jgi:hypothetical protein
VVTHPRVYHPPMPLQRARVFLSTLLECPSLVLLSETPRHPEVLEEVLAESGVTGNLIHDAHIAALCREHGVAEILTTDKDFLRFRRPATRDPFAA